MSSENAKVVFDAIAAFKAANPWYDRATAIVRQYHETIERIKPKPQYVIVTGDTSLPYYFPTKTDGSR